MVVDMFDRTEFLQMLGRIRISGNQKIKLYIRHYSDEYLKKSLVQDMQALITRLATRFVPKEVRADYYQDFPNHRYKKEQLFRLTEGKKQFKYNVCAVYKLIERITVLFKVIRAGNPDYFIDLNALGDCRADRAKLYNFYLQRIEYKHSTLIRDQLCQILEINDERQEREEQLNDVDFSKDMEFTFLAYLFKVLIPDAIAAEALSDSGIEHNGWYEEDFYALNSFYEKLDNVIYEMGFSGEDVSSLEQALKNADERYLHFSPLLELNGAECPVLTEQMNWIERHTLKRSMFHFLDEKKMPELPDAKQIANLIEEHSISRSDFEKNTKTNKQNISFSDSALLQSKGSRINPLNEAYQTIFECFSTIDNTQYKASELQSKLERDPATFGERSYTLQIVRGTKADDQYKYCIFVQR